jgi:hypothetical protein
VCYSKRIEVHVARKGLITTNEEKERNRRAKNKINGVTHMKRSDKKNYIYLLKYIFLSI